MRYYFFALGFFLSVLTVQAQNQSYSVKSKKAIKSFEMGKANMNARSYELAIDRFNEALAEDGLFIEAWLMKAEASLDLERYDDAISSFERALQIDSSFFPNALFFMAKAQMSSGKYADAIVNFTKTLKMDGISDRLKSKAAELIPHCEYAYQLSLKPVPFDPVNLGDSVNSMWSEYWPSLSVDGQTLVYTVLRPKEGTVLKAPLSITAQEDFYVARRGNGYWHKGVELDGNINSAQNEGAQSLSADGRMMYFTACNRTDGKGRCDIYRSYVKNEQWSAPQNVGAPINTPHRETQPSISSDGQRLYFASDRPGGKGSIDIWMSELTPEGRWGNPVNLGDSINTPGDEQSPFIHADGVTLYFSSDGWPGMGKSDLFRAQYKPDGTLEKAKNLGYPINTWGDEIGLIVSAAGDKALYASDRMAGRYNDIYQFDLYKEARPIPVSYLKGRVYDSQSKQPLKARFELISLNDTVLVNRAVSDSTSGEFLVCIPTDRRYALNVSHPGYLFYSDNFEMTGINDVSKPFLKDVPLQAIRSGEKTVLHNIFFETGSVALKRESTAELEKLVRFLKENPHVSIEIGGHTDDTGKPEFNLKLSYERAQSVANYMINRGIDAVRIQSKGYGITEPVATNDTEEGRAKNRRTEFKIISVH